MFEIMEKDSQEAVIKVIGVGGCGGNAIEHMITKNLSGVEFICANTDMQALKKSNAKTVLQIGVDITKGLGAGAKPEGWHAAALCRLPDAVRRLQRRGLCRRLRLRFDAGLFLLLCGAARDDGQGRESAAKTLGSCRGPGMGNTFSGALAHL